jgi:DMSO reductase anchor subunit
MFFIIVTVVKGVVSVFLSQPVYSLSIAQNGNQHTGKIFLLILHPIEGKFPIYIKNSRTYTPENQISLLKMGYIAKEIINNRGTLNS